MIHIRLAWHGIIHHRQQFGPFLLASIVLMAVNFTFFAVLNNTGLKTIEMGEAIRSVTTIGTVFTIILSAIFMLYANNFLNKQRNQDLSIYSMLGLRLHDLRFIVIIEQMILWLLTIVMGIIAGTTFFRLSFLLLKHLLGSNTLVEQLPVRAIVSCCILFSVIFCCLIIYNIYQLHQVKPIQLMRQSQATEKAPKNRWLMSWFGLALLGTGYAISVMTKPNLSAILQFMLAVVLVTVGTYILFIMGSITLLKYLKSRPHFYYRPNHFIAVSGMLFRMKQNGASLASICLLCASILVTMVASVSLFVGEGQLIKQWNPLDIMTLSQSDTLSQHEQQIVHLGRQHDIKAGNIYQARMTTPIIGDFSGNQYISHTNISKGVSQLSTMTLADYNQIQGTKLKLKDDEVLVYTQADDFHQQTLKINGHTYHSQTIAHFKLAANYGHSIFKPIFIITANQQVAQTINPQKWLRVNGFNLYGGTQKQRYQFAQQLQTQLKLDNASYTASPILSYTFHAIFGGLIFVGVLVSMTMAIATALMIYYKQISEGYADRWRFKTLQQVGLSLDETKQAIHSQVLLVFMLPILGATIHLGFALPALKSVLSLFSMYNLSLLLTVSGVTIILLVVGYLIIYALTTKAYQRIVIHR